MRIRASSNQISTNTKAPYLYHATYTNKIADIKENGLGLTHSRDWEISEDKEVCLSTNPISAYNKLMESKNDNETSIVMLKVSVSELRLTSIYKAKMENSNDACRFMYAGVIPANSLIVMSNKSTEIGRLNTLKNIETFKI